MDRNSSKTESATKMIMSDWLDACQLNSQSSIPNHL
jgi:hypothetical protein